MLQAVHENWESIILYEELQATIHHDMYHSVETMQDNQAVFFWLIQDSQTPKLGQWILDGIECSQAFVEF